MDERQDHERCLFLTAAADNDRQPRLEQRSVDGVVAAEAVPDRAIPSQPDRP